MISVKTTKTDTSSAEMENNNLTSTKSISKRHELQNLIGSEVSDFIEMINSAPSCFKLVNKDGMLLNMNPAGLHMIGADNTNDLPEAACIYNVVHPHHREEYIKFNESVCSGTPGKLAFRIYTMDGSIRWMESFASPYRLVSGEIAHLAVTNDITERINAMKELREKDMALEESGRLSALGEFAAGIAHEINNPLAIISGKAALIQARLEGKLPADLAETVNRDIKTILDTIQRSSETINNLKT